VLSAGRFDTVVASSDDLIARVKVPRSHPTRPAAVEQARWPDQVSQNPLFAVPRPLFRVGTTRGRGDRLGPDGRPLPGHSAENKHVDGVPVEGKFFGR
jgi:hypothetical protein